SSGLGVLSGKFLDMSLARQISQYMPLTICADDPQRPPVGNGVDYVPSRKYVVRAIVEASDVVIVCGECRELSEIYSKCKTILVSHGGPASESTVKMVRQTIPYATHYAAGSEIALETY